MLTSHSPAAPHGPDMDGHHSPLQNITANERQIFDYLLRPDDLYDANGTYWADLPLAKRIKFVTSYDAAESRRELRSLGAMMKKDPLSPIPWYFKNMVLPGAGLGLEGYVLFSLGNITSIFTAKGTYEVCWKAPYPACDQNWIAAVTYMEIIGIMVGQVLVGVLGGPTSVTLVCARGLMFVQGTGSAVAGVSSRTPRSCSWACSCSRPPGARR